MSRLRTTVLFAGLLFLPVAAHAQASMTGVVRDASAGVLPGATVEVSSPALIEKVRTAVTDGTGQYRIEILPPGTYTVTFTLPGFSTFRREGIELSGTFTASVDAEMRVGALEETVTVTGESPLVDVQSSSRQRVVDREMIDQLPGGRSVFSMAALIPGVGVTDGTDVGGANAGLSGVVNMQVHGARGQAQLLMESGLPTNAFGVPSTSRMTFNMAAAQEITFEYAGSGAAYNAGGVTMNIIPREGGNTFNGTFFANGTTSGLQGENFTKELADAGLLTPDAVRSMLDVNPGFGGPLKRDRLWFYTSGRYAANSTWVAGEFYDKNFNNPAVWIYEPDLSRPVASETTVKDGRVRLTWQATPKVKIGGIWVEQTALDFPGGVGPSSSSVVSTNPGVRLTAYEATSYTKHPIQRHKTIDVTSPWTNRVLFDGALMHMIQVNSGARVPGLSQEMTQVLDQATNRTYRGRNGSNSRGSTRKYAYRASISYITGAHSIKFGVNDVFGYIDSEQDEVDRNPLSFRFNSGVPNQLTQRAPSNASRSNVDHQFGAFVQDRWTVARLTLNVGLRFDWFKNSFPEQSIGPAVLAPTRSVVLPETSNLSWYDLNPKMGVAYDLFGDGRTALKASFNRFVQQYTVNGIAGSRNPINTLVTSTTRNWTDADRDFVPDCDLMNLGANGECGAVANRSFGSVTSTANFDPEILTGWNKRDYNWEFTGGVQRELVRNVSADFTYFRRWFGNFVITDNLEVGPADYSRFDLTVPVDPRLPGGGGYVVRGVHDLVPAKVGAVDNYTTFSDNYGEQINRYDGIALNVSARLPGRVTVQGGFDSGKTKVDNCEIVAKVPELLFGGLALSSSANPSVWTPAEFCHQETPFQTQVKLLGSYTVPRIDVQASATFQSTPGPLVLANYAVPAAQVTPLIGRAPTAGANVAVELVEPGTIYVPRFKQVDFRLSKILRFGRTKVTASADVYNLLNDNAVLSQSNAYTATSWQQPQTIMMARFAKFGVQFDF